MSKLSKAAKKPLKSLLNIATLGQSGAISKALQNIRGKKGSASVGTPSPVPAPGPTQSIMPVGGTPNIGSPVAPPITEPSVRYDIPENSPYFKQREKDYLKDRGITQGPESLDRVMRPPPSGSDMLLPGGPATPWTDPRKFIPVSNDPNYHGEALKLNPAYNPLLPQPDLKQAYLEKLKGASKALLPPRVPGPEDKVLFGGGLNLGPQERGFSRGGGLGGSLGNMKDSMGPVETPEAKRQKALNRFQTGNYGGK